MQHTIKKVLFTSIRPIKEFLHVCLENCFLVNTRFWQVDNQHLQLKILTYHWDCLNEIHNINPTQLNTWSLVISCLWKVKGCGLLTENKFLGADFVASKDSCHSQCALCLMCAIRDVSTQLFFATVILHWNHRIQPSEIISSIICFLL